MFRVTNIAFERKIRVTYPRTEKEGEKCASGSTVATQKRKKAVINRLYEPLMGLEPTTCSLRMSRSTN